MLSSDTKDSEAHQGLPSDLRASREQAGRKHHVEVSFRQTEGKRHLPRSRVGGRSRVPLGELNRKQLWWLQTEAKGSNQGRDDEEGQALRKILRAFSYEASPAGSAGFQRRAVCPHPHTPSKARAKRSV